MDIQHAWKYAKKKMSKLGLIKKGWKLRLSKGRVCFGECDYEKKTIGLSKRLTLDNDFKEVRDTLLHEFAHALDKNDGSSNPHGDNWKDIATKLGARAETKFDDSKVKVAYKYQLICPKCGRFEYRHKRKRGKYLCDDCIKL